MGERPLLTRSTGYYSRCDFRRPGVHHSARIVNGKNISFSLSKKKFFHFFPGVPVKYVHLGSVSLSVITTLVT